MQLLRFRKEKWKHPKPEVRMEAIADLGLENQGIFATIVQEDDIAAVRLTALQKIQEIEILDSLLTLDRNADIQDEIRQRINTLLLETVLSSAEMKVQMKAVSRIIDQETLGIIAVQAQSPDVRLQAVKKIENQETLVDVLSKNCGKRAAIAALEKISDPDILEQIMNSGASVKIRRRAREKQHLATKKVSKEELQSTELQKIVYKAEELSEMWNSEEAAAEFETLQESWRKIDPDESNRLKERFDTALISFDAKRKEFTRFKEIKKREGEQISELFDQQKRILSLINDFIGSTDPGADREVDQAAAQWEENREMLKNLFLEDSIDHLLPMERYSEIFRQYKRVGKKVKKERAVYEEFHTELLRISSIAGGNSPDKARKPIKALRKKFSESDFEYFEIHDLTVRLDDIETAMKASIKKLQADIEEERTGRINQCEELCAKIESLIQADSFAQDDLDFSSFQESWRQIQKENDEEFQELERRFLTDIAALKEARDNFFSQKDWQRWANKTRQLELVAAVEGLAQETDLAVVAKKVREARTGWKEIGPAPSKEAKRIWDRFNRTCNEQYERCQPYFAEQKTKRDEILKRKKEICLEAEEHIQSVEWQKSGQLLKKLQQEWNRLGFAYKGEEKKLSERFRKATHTFFDRRRQDMEQKQGVWQENLSQKNSLCEEMEKQAENPDWQNIKEVLALQRKWKKIGPVQRAKEKETWERFRNAGTVFFTKLDEEKEQNLKEKEDICHSLETILATSNDDSDWRVILQNVAAFDEKWISVGPIPDKSRDEIEKQFIRLKAEVSALQKKYQERRSLEKLDNLYKKTAILAEIEGIAESKDTQHSQENLDILRGRWDEIGEIPKEKDQELQKQFQFLCDVITRGDMKSYLAAKAKQLENFKKKELLCFRLEKIVGIDTNTGKTASQNSTLTLAEELKLAMEINTLLAGSGDKNALKKQELESIKQEWKGIGGVTYREAPLLEKRFQRALDFFAAHETHAKKGETRKQGRRPPKTR